MLSIIESETCNVNENLKGVLAMNVARNACNIGWMNIAQRIMYERKKKGWNQSELARALSEAGQKVTPQSVQQWERGETEPRSKKIQLMAQLFNVDPYWLQYGEERKAATFSNSLEEEATKQMNAHGEHGHYIGDEGKPKEKLQQLPYSASDEALEKKLSEEFVLVPRYDVKASMENGYLIHSEQIVDHLAFKRNWVQVELGINPSNLALITAIGDSMEPTLRPGDLILVDRSVQHVVSDSVYVLALDGELLAKRIQRLFDGSLEIISDNPAYKTQILNPEQVERLGVVGRVVWAGRRM